MRSNHMHGIKDNHKLIEGYTEYFVTDTGEVYAYRDRHVGWQGLRKLTPKGKNNPNRYLQVCLSDENGKKYFQIHTLVAKHFCDGYFDGAVVNHKDRNIHNNVASNLEWITQKENIRKSYSSSGVGPTRNYNIFELRAPDGELLGEFVGRNKAVAYVREMGFDTSCSSLIRHGESRGYTLLKKQSEAVTTTGYGYSLGETPRGEAPASNEGSALDEDIVYAHCQEQCSSTGKPGVHSD